MEATAFMTSANGNLQEMRRAKVKRLNPPIEVIDLSQSSDGEEENGINTGVQSINSAIQQSKWQKNLDVIAKVMRKGDMKPAIQVIDLSQGYQERKLDGNCNGIQPQVRKRQKRPRAVSSFPMDPVDSRDGTSERPSLREANGNLPPGPHVKEVGHLKKKMKSSGKLADEGTQKRKKESTPGADGASVEKGIKKAGTTAGEDGGPQKKKAKARRKPEGLVGNADKVADGNNDIMKTKKRRRKKTEESPRDPSVVVPDSCSPSAGKEKIEEKEIVIPTGVEMVQVANVELPPNAVGPALQVLEFCSAFRQPLKLRKNQAEKVLQEMARGGTLRRGGQSDLIQLHVRLLSMILDEEEEEYQIAFSSASKNCWLQILRKHFFKESASSQDKEDATCSMKSSSPSCLSWPLLTEDGSLIEKALQDGFGGYGELALATRVQLLASLCDDSLSTTVMRDYLEKVISDHNNELKEDREKVLALKRRVRQSELFEDAETSAYFIEIKEEELKMEPEANDVSATGKSVPTLTSRGHAQLLAKITRQSADLAASEVTQSETTARLHGPRCDAVRTDPAAVHITGGRFWRLHGADERSVVLFQDIRDLELNVPKELWSIFSKDQSEEVGQCIEAICLREKIARRPHPRRPRKKEDPPTALPGDALPGVDIGDDVCATPILHVVLSSSSESI